MVRQSHHRKLLPEHARGRGGHYRDIISYPQLRYATPLAFLDAAHTTDPRVFMVIRKFILPPHPVREEFVRAQGGLQSPGWYGCAADSRRRGLALATERRLGHQRTDVPVPRCVKDERSVPHAFTFRSISIYERVR
jgi:hypothetical protein